MFSYFFHFSLFLNTRIIFQIKDKKEEFFHFSLLRLFAEISILIKMKKRRVRVITKKEERKSDVFNKKGRNRNEKEEIFAKRWKFFLMFAIIKPNLFLTEYL